MRERLHLRPDQRPEAGGGHLSRCLSLGIAWCRWGGTATVEDGAMGGLWRDRYASAGIDVVSVPEAGGWTVLDDYHTTLDDQRAAVAAGGAVVIDDHVSLGSYEADVVVDQNAGSRVQDYPVEPSTLVLAGLAYAMLRPEFASTSHRLGAVPADVRRVVLSLGAAPHEQDRAVIKEVGEALRVNGYEVDDLVGAEHVAEHLAAAQLAVAACGTTAYELCCVGTPALLVAVADNQEPVGMAVDSLGAATYAGRLRDLTAGGLAREALTLAVAHERRSVMATRGRSLIDGLGARRVVAALRSRDIRLRPAVRDDARLLWEWANDPDVRRFAFHTEPIVWDDHLNWLDDRLSRDDSLVYVAELDGSHIGQVRFDLADHVANIDYSIAPSWRGRGLGSSLLVAAVARLNFDRPGAQPVGVVLAANAASHRSFELAGFRCAADDGRAVRWKSPCRMEGGS